MKRRSFLQTTGILGLASPALLEQQSIPEPIIIATWKNEKGTQAGYQKIMETGKALDGVEAGAWVPEADPNEILYKQRCLVLSFEQKATADADDLALADVDWPADRDAHGRALQRDDDAHAVCRVDLWRVVCGPPRPALAEDPRSLPDLAFRNHAATNAGQYGDSVFPALHRLAARPAVAGTGIAGRGPRAVVRPGLLRPRAQFASLRANSG